MSDTQWPRFYVFKQNETDGPFLNCGSVHAPDGEMALQNARDVFVRRPHCVNLWVVPAGAMLSITAEEAGNGKYPDSQGRAETHTYAIFVKPSHKDRHAYVGDLEARSSADALREAVEQFSQDSPVAWRVAPRAAVIQSDASEAQAWFGPAYDKAYRQPTFYHTEKLMREIKEAQRRKEASSG